MDDKDLEKDQKQAELDDASQKTAHVAGKAAATYFGGGVGGKIYDVASQTKVGQDIEKVAGKALQRQPGANKAMEGLNKSGALDAANKGLDLAGGDSTSAGAVAGKTPTPEVPVETSSDGQSQSSGSLFGGKGSGNGLFSSFGKNNQQSTSSDSSFSTKMFEFFKKHKIKLLQILGGIVLFFIVLLLIMFVILVLVQGVTSFFNGIVDFFTTDQQELEQEYYETLKEVQTDINKKYGVCIDVNLITAALTINTPADEFLENGQQNVVDGEDNPNYDSNDEESEEEPTVNVDYKLMKKQIKLLANMQMMTMKYELDKLENEGDSYCANPSETIPVTEGEKDSSTKELIAQHDLTGFAAFFTKKSNEEKNYAYFIYKPPFKRTEIENADGTITVTETCTKSYAKDMLPKEEKVLSIGDLATREDSVFYWNLVNSFIPEYYDEYLPDTDPERTERIKEMAEEIYLLYKDIGPSQTCATSYAGPSSLCPNGITVEGVGVMDLEEYIAGVVSNEAYTSEGMEALKAQAVAARTYALYSTNYCQSPIANSTSAQTFTQNINDRAREATNATRGEVLTDRDGNIFSANYDSFCYEDGDCPDATKSGSSYTVTYTKVPYGEQHTITLSDSAQFGRILSGQGHARGMSQLVSYQLAKQGKSYQEILAYFYSEGVSINLVLSPSVTDGSTIIQGPISDYLVAAGSSVESFNSYIFDQVRKSGIGTREGVVAAATSLVSGFYSQTGHILPYELYPSGKYSGYGIDTAWGTNTGRSDYPLNGLDCSGFISWAVHNGGFAYEVKSAASWGNAGTKRPWTKGITDSSAQPGDLIFNEPASSNGTTGHIRMIIGVGSDGYVVAEASSKKNGVRIINMPFKSTGNYYLVDMSSYYANATVVTDYPE